MRDKPIYLIYHNEKIFTDAESTAATADGTEEDAVKRAKKIAEAHNIHVADLKVREFVASGRVIDVHL